MSKLRRVADPRHLSPSRAQNQDLRAGSSRQKGNTTTTEFSETKRKKPWWTAIYNAEDKTCCYRNFKSWILIISYSVMYLIFLSTFTMILLFASLSIIKASKDFNSGEKTHLLTYAEKGVGLTAIPTSEHSDPLIWYQENKPEGYQKYVNALDQLFTKRRKRELNNITNYNYNLGPCGYPPYGYGDNPCIIIKINKQLNWVPLPLHLNSSKAKLAPPEVRKWMQMDKTKLWLHCSGYHSYDKEHIRKIKYYPDPPGFDPHSFPRNIKDHNPVIAVQISDFTLGISLNVECKLWCGGRISSIDFILYVAPQDRLLVKSER